MIGILAGSLEEATKVATALKIADFKYIVTEHDIHHFRYSRVIIVGDGFRQEENVLLKRGCSVGYHPTP